MRSRVFWVELPLILVTLIFAEAGEVLRELRTDVILDWFVSLAPLIWINVSILVLYAFLRLYHSPELASTNPGSAKSRGASFLMPNFRALRGRERGFRRLWGIAGVAYAVAYMLLQGMLIVDPSGSIDPVFTDLGSPIGYGPGIAWAPTTTFGILLRPFSIAAAAALSILSGLVLALSLRFFAASRKAATALPGPLLGFAVMCPACVGAPVSGLFLAYIAPFASMGGLGAASALSRMLVVSTALLVVTLVLLWIVIAVLSNLSVSGLLPGDTHRSSPD